MPGTEIPENVARFVYIGTSLTLPDDSEESLPGPSGDVLGPGAELDRDFVEKNWVGMDDLVALFDESGRLIRTAGAGKEHPEIVPERLGLGEQPVQLEDES